MACTESPRATVVKPAAGDLVKLIAVMVAIGAYLAFRAYGHF
jgi:hypothetical protein